MLAATAPFHEQITSFFFSLLGAYFIYRLRAKTVLNFGRANNSLNELVMTDPNNPSQTNRTEIYCEKFFVQNTGRKTATEIEFVLSSWPNHVSIWQPRAVKYESVGAGNCMISIPRMAPRELVVIDCVYINKVAASVVSVKCADVLGKEVQFQTVRRYPPFVNFSAFLLWILGFAFILQIAYQLIS